MYVCVLCFTSALPFEKCKSKGTTTIVRKCVSELQYESVWLYFLMVEKLQLLIIRGVFSYQLKNKDTLILRAKKTFLFDKIGFYSLKWKVEGVNEHRVSNK